MAQRTVTVSFHGCTRAVGAFLFSCGFLLLCDANAAITGRILIAGYGPELPVVQDLAKAYERLHPGTAIDLEWDSTVRAVHLLKIGEAQVAVTDQPDPALRATQIAWDGIAVIVNFANPVRAVSSTQVRGFFSAQITNWSELDGATARVEVILRTSANNLTSGFQSSLSLTELVAASAARGHSDQQVLSLVPCRDATVSYISLAAALKAQEDGISIHILTVDQVDPGEATVKMDDTVCADRSSCSPRHNRIPSPNRFSPSSTRLTGSSCSAPCSSHRTIGPCNRPFKRAAA